MKLKYNEMTFTEKLESLGINYKCTIYNGVLTKSQFYCEKHNHYFGAKPNAVSTRNTGCPICSGKVIKHTFDSFNKSLEERGIKYRLIGEYTGNKVETEFYCEEHDHIFDAKPNAVSTRNTKCPKCPGEKVGRKPHSIDSFNKKLEDRGIKYKLVGEYTTNDKITQFYCEEHDHIFDAIPNNILIGGKQCPICTGFVRWNKETFNENLKNNNIPYILVGEFKSVNDDTEFYCEKHDHIFIGRPFSVSGGAKQCPKCSGRTVWSKELLQNVLDENDTKIKIIGEFTSIDNTVVCYCENCNYTWDAHIANIIYRESGCPNCCHYGFDPTKPAIVYYVKITDQDIYKIGITNLTVQKRFQSEYKMMTELFILPFEIGIEAYKFEQSILKKYREYKYVGKPILKRGNTELFEIDILDKILEHAEML